MLHTGPVLPSFKILAVSSICVLLSTHYESKVVRICLQSADICQ